MDEWETRLGSMERYLRDKTQRLDEREERVRIRERDLGPPPEVRKPSEAMSEWEERLFAWERSLRAREGFLDAWAERMRKKE